MPNGSVRGEHHLKSPSRATGASTTRRELDAVDLSEYVIVEADRGEDLGRVTAAGAIAERKCSGCSTGCAAPVPTPARGAPRAAGGGERAVTLRADEPRVRRITREKVLHSTT
jgi:hypothetical protein